MKQSNPWFSSSNAAGIALFDNHKDTISNNYPNISQADLSLTTGYGTFTNYDSSNKLTTSRASVESIYRISRHTVLSGGISYEAFRGKNMGGSVFMPANIHRPFDIVEDSITNLGKKHSDTYHLIGSFATTIHKGIAIGGKIDYTAANYAKYKDLRHQNKLMDLQLSAGVFIPLYKWLNVGAHYSFQHNIESVKFGTYGKSDKVYMSLIDFANFTGMVEQFGNDGYTDKSREMPLVDDRHGVGIAFSVHPHNSLSFYNEYQYSHRTGYYGNHSPFTISYTEHNGDVFKYKAQLRYNKQSEQHIAEFFMDVENLTNNATTHRETKNVSGATSYDYYTPVKTADKVWKNYGLSYTIYSGIRQELPTLTIQGGVNRMERKQTAYLYPYLRRQNIKATKLFFNTSYTIFCKCGLFTIIANGSYSKGNGSPYEDALLATPSAKRSAPPTMNTWLMREYDYLTASQYSIGAAIKYSFLLPQTNLNTFVSFGVNNTKANGANLSTEDSHHTQGKLSIGCVF